MANQEAILVPGLAAIGSYSQAVRANGFLFVSGQPGVHPATGVAPSDVFEVQARQAFVNLETVLRAGESRLDLVVSTTVLLSDVANFAEFNEMFREFFPENPPARMTMQALLPRGLLISIGCVALVA
jgi:2-iminobutanoate/2-iminopropanoate deaminase